MTMFKDKDTKTVNATNSTFLMLDHVPIGVCVVDSDDKIRFWNRCMEDWSGIDREFIVNTELAGNFPCFGELWYRSRIQSVFKDGLPIIFSAQLHKNLFPLFLSNGGMRLQHTTVTAVPKTGGDGFFALFAVEDVTELVNYTCNAKQEENSGEKSPVTLWGESS